MSQGKKVGVLIAEDDPLVSEMIRGTLEDLGYTVVGEAIDGRQAVELTGVLQPDVILMDIEMPGVNGIEAAQQIYATHPTPIVMLTAYETPTLVQQASMAGVGAYLVKPPRARELERAIIIAMARFDDLMKLRRLNKELQAALAKVKMLSGLLPICASCKKIRDDKGYWQQVEVYIQDHSEAEFTHGFCPDCLAKLYPDYFFRP
ncbi:MAG TPA: response regulator [Anaerolineae bacterium]|nr:response regulator [Anaerolineae bacterium]